MEAVSIDLALSDPVASFKPLACEIRALLSGDTTNLASRLAPVLQGTLSARAGIGGRGRCEEGVDRPTSMQCP